MTTYTAYCFRYERVDIRVLINALFGVRARLVDKDLAPKWDPSCLDKVMREMVDHYFSPLSESEPKLELPVKIARSVLLIGDILQKPYLPFETPAGLKELREKELSDLRGDGQGEGSTRIGYMTTPYIMIIQTKGLILLGPNLEVKQFLYQGGVE
ncbi:hypothetical protein IFM89_029583 [Coptis chinensis]|uniref:Lipoxygenase domain-containing protein n=1 Tax=Coptis chinensis TaxID=261450 RepID=A0A835H1C8_9MAGN|nr:hypothetical protein IFM89_029583 [Coptis chinensis]